MHPRGVHGGAEVAVCEGNSRGSQPDDRASSLSPRYVPRVQTPLIEGGLSYFHLFSAPRTGGSQRKVGGTEGAVHPPASLCCPGGARGKRVVAAPPLHPRGVQPRAACTPCFRQRRCRQRVSSRPLRDVINDRMGCAAGVLLVGGDACVHDMRDAIARHLTADIVVPPTTCHAVVRGPSASSDQSPSPSRCSDDADGRTTGAPRGKPAGRMRPRACLFWPMAVLRSVCPADVQEAVGSLLGVGHDVRDEGVGAGFGEDELDETALGGGKSEHL